MPANGSKADVTVRRSDFRFAPKSGLGGRRPTSVLCHEETHAPQQNVFLFDHLIGAAERSGVRRRPHLGDQRGLLPVVPDAQRFLKLADGNIRNVLTVVRWIDVA
jgi:hypothetical protein